jgi:hypothetical protein
MKLREAQDLQSSRPSRRGWQLERPAGRVAELGSLGRLAHHKPKQKEEYAVIIDYRLGTRVRAGCRYWLVSAPTLWFIAIIRDSCLVDVLVIRIYLEIFDDWSA